MVYICMTSTLLKKPNPQCLRGVLLYEAGQSGYYDSNMHKLNEEGSLLVPLIAVSVLLLSSLGFGFWAFAGRQDYKNNVDAKIQEAVVAANETLTAEKDAEFAEKEKSPFVTYAGSATYGALTITYPKTWSAYIDETGKGATPLSGYMHPRFVPATNSDTNFAFRFEVVDTAYDTVLKTFDSGVRTGKVSVNAYRAPKVDSVLGARIEGEIISRKQGVLVLLPIRDKTIKVWTEGQEFRADFSAILEALSFVP